MIRDTANKLIESCYGLLPYETAKHLANAQKEFLQAISSMIDEQIKWTDIHVEESPQQATADGQLANYLMSKPKYLLFSLQMYSSNSLSAAYVSGRVTDHGLV